MNLEDFKSFRRALKPSEVGSIPTHSRHLRSCSAALARHAAIVAFGLVAASPSSAAEETIVPSPANRAARSALFPAWGQLTNGANVKAAALFALETYLVTGIIHESHRARAHRYAADAATDEATSAMYDGLADAHYDRRRNLFFWSILAVLYGVIDAYVDAHLTDFDEELEDRRELLGSIDPVENSVEVGFRF